jgi:large subunit ribosomal protein L10
MPSKKNISEVGELEASIEAAKGVFLADYAGLSVNEQVTLRDKVRAAGGELKISKNNLLKIALKNKGFAADSIAEELTGPNITLYAREDIVAPLKALVEFAKGSDKEKPALKAGFLGTDLLTIEKIKQLASLPTKLELIAQLMATLANPARNMVGVLTAPTRNLVYALNAIKDQKNAN